MRRTLVLLVAASALAVVAHAAPEAAPEAPAEAAVEAAPAPVSAEAQQAAVQAWAGIYAVLTHPRCLNCHPNGDRPLQTDASVFHSQNISRRTEKNGMECATCHRHVNSEELGIAGGPPGAPHWHLPAEDMPLIFQDRDAKALCIQLKDRAHNGNRSLADLVKHVTHDKLVLWGWEPGGNRTKPPMSHADFVKAMQTWADGGGACPE